VRRAIKRLIGSVGRQVELFASAHEFLASKPANGGASCLVLDIRLPGISGLDFQRQLADAKVQIPIVFITAHGDIPMTVRAMKAGAVEFLTKPFRDQDLLDAIQVALERDRSRRQQESDLAVLRERFELLSPREREVVTTVPFSTLFSTTSLASANNSVPQGRNPPARRCRSSLASGNRRSQTMALSPISAEWRTCRSGNDDHGYLPAPLVSGELFTEARQGERDVMEQAHKFRVVAWWSSGRTGIAKADSAPNAIHFTAPVSFGGVEGRWTPEDLLLGAIASCFTTTFRAIADHSRFAYVDLQVEVSSTVAQDDGGYGFAGISIRANLVVAREEDAQLGVKLLHKTKALCLVARALAIQQAFDPAVTVAPSLVGAPGNGTIAGDCDRAAASE
jgi:FixJ family two-component response regulator/organic hydroperoxide reductase OsmC/OhrA